MVIQKNPDKIVGIIPARYDSTRLPGKPLAMIGGKPMIIRTYDSSMESNLLDRIIVATDNQKVFKECEKYKIETRMTPKNCASGSDRIALIAAELTTAEIILNIQGDEPFIPGMMIDQAISPLLMDPTIQVSTLATRIKDIEELKSASVVKVVFDLTNNALYFSRSIIPYVRDARDLTDAFKKRTFYKHIGLYAFRRKALLAFTSKEKGDLEECEKLEQLRMLEHGMKIRVVETEEESFSVDTKEDLYKANQMMIHRSKRKK
jgi:3-deoxy-manno-octulosonate cytidylyltransferase (CMP-KDO synthetase)